MTLGVRFAGVQGRQQALDAEGMAVQDRHRRPWRRARRRGAGWPRWPLPWRMAAPAGARRAGKSAVLVIDANTGRVLHQSAADEPRHPASLAKMMTLYMAFELIEQGRLSYQTKIKISANAAAAAPSKLDLEEGEEIALIDAIKALITKSANDVAVAIAEHIAGSEEKFARLMTQKARQLGMPATTFRNASGLPDDEQVTTARDMVTLALQSAGRLSPSTIRCLPRAPSPTRTRRSATTTRCCPTTRAPTASRPATRAPPASTWWPPCGAAASTWWARSSAAPAPPSRNAAMRTFLNMGLVKASNEKTRQPAAPLMAQARGPRRAQGRAGADAHGASRVPPADRDGCRAASRGTPPAEPAAAQPSPAAIPLAGHRDRARALRPVSPRAGNPPSPRCRYAARRHRPPRTCGASRPAARRPSMRRPTRPVDHRAGELRAGNMPMHVAGTSMEKPACSPASPCVRGAPPSTLETQAANLARGEPPVAAPPPPPRMPRATPRPQPAGRGATPPLRRPPPHAGAFHIQIGAYQSQAEAEKRLASARELAPGVLGNRRCRDDAGQAGRQARSSAPATRASRPRPPPAPAASSSASRSIAWSMKAE